MKVQNFTVELDKPDLIFSAGETITGKVSVTILAEVDIKHIRIKALGKAEVRWEEDSSTTDSQGNNHTSTDTYSNHETYFKSCHVLYGDSSGENVVQLAPGDYVFLFGIELPPNIPHTFNHRYGSIEYQLEAVLERPRKTFLKKNSRKIIVPFCVKPPHHIIQYSTFTTAQVLEASVQSNANCFAPGETIILNIIQNMNTTNVELNRISMRLEQNFIFHASTRFKTCSTTAQKIKSTGPYRGQEKIQLQMTVPELPPSRLDHCSIIDLKYELILKLVPKSNSSVTRRYPIEIGLRNPSSCDSEVPEPSAPSMEAAFENLTLVPLSTSSLATNPNLDINTRLNYSDEPPPSYEECIAGLTEGELLRRKLQRSEDVSF